MKSSAKKGCKITWGFQKLFVFLGIFWGDQFFSLILLNPYISSVFGLSQVQTNAFTVNFDEHYSIPIDLCSLEEYSLRFAAFGIDADERNISAGVAELKLSDLDLTIRPFNAWLYLQDVNKISYTTVMCHGGNLI